MKASLIPCKHNYHSECIQRWALSVLRPSCPLCKNHFRSYLCEGHVKNIIDAFEEENEVDENEEDENEVRIDRFIISVKEKKSSLSGGRNLLRFLCKSNHFGRSIVLYSMLFLLYIRTYCVYLKSIAITITGYVCLWNVHSQSSKASTGKYISFLRKDLQKCTLRYFQAIK